MKILFSFLTVYLFSMISLANLKAPLWRMDVGGTSENYSSDFRTEESTYFIQLGRQLNSDLSLYARFVQENRFNETVQVTAVGSYYKLNPQIVLNMDYGLADKSASFLPKTALGAGFEYYGFSQWILSLNYRGLNYSTGYVNTAQPGIRYEWNTGAVEIKYNFTENADGSNAQATQTKYEYNHKDEIILYVGYTLGTESLPPQDKAKITVIPAGVIYKWSPDQAVRLDVATEDRKDVYTHTTVALGYTLKF